MYPFSFSLWTPFPRITGSVIKLPLIDLRLYHITQRQFTGHFTALSSQWLFSTWRNCGCWLASLAIISWIRRPPVGSPVPPGREGGRGVEARMWGSAAAEKLALHWYCYTSLQWQESPPTQASELVAVAAGGSRVHPEPCIQSIARGLFQLSRQDREFLPFSLMLRDEIENFFLSVSCFKTRSRFSFS